jgi:hypothetical protein
MAQITVEIQQWHLTDPAAMVACLEDMSQNGFRGMVRVTPEPPPVEPPEGWVAQPVWDMELNDNAHLDRPAVNANIGKVVVFFGGVLQVMTTESFTSQFGEAP